jgi:uncharacterized heparinase superfamily protein
MGKLLLLINTVKYLKWQQIYYRLVRKFVKPKVTDSFSGVSPKRSDAWEHMTLYEEKIDKHLNACFLNHSKQLDLPTDWNNEGCSKLWVYNLHYFEDLLSDYADEKRNLHLQLLNSWVDDNPVGYGNGWEPYPTSLRIVNILKAWLGGLELDDTLFKSVHSQASYLTNDLEKHLLGNHYFVNLKALLFAGVIFDNTHWSAIAERGLLAEIPEQVLLDGANFELSPMYHSLILVDMLDMFNLNKAYPTCVSYKLVSLFEDYIPRMLVFLDAMAHPDGGVSFFNDSVDGIAPSKARIEKYAEKLGFEICPLDSGKTQIIDNTNSGYICATAAGNKLIFDASPVGPDYIPGHAHADTLSFELSIGAQRVFVNSGISEYRLSSRRLEQRKTRSHNTVEVDGKDSSQVWSSFRVARRARIIERSAELVGGCNILLKAVHNGYKKLFSGCIHTRKLVLNNKSLLVSDSLAGSFRGAIARFHIHPDLKTRLESDILKIEGENVIIFCDLSKKQARVVDSTWNPEFGRTISNKVLEIDFSTNQLELNFTWINSD